MSTTSCGQDVLATSTWFMAPRPDMDARRREAYELLELTVDGRPQPIRRSTRATDQTYSVDLDNEARSGKPIRICQVFRTMTPQWSHRLYFAVSQPTRGWSLRLDYTDTNITEVHINDTMATTPASSIIHSPEAVPGKEITIETSNWLLPQSGVAFTWATNNELPQTKQPEAVASSRDGWLYFVGPRCMPEGSRSSICCFFAALVGQQTALRMLPTVAVSLPSSVDAALDPLDFLATSPTMRRPRKKSQGSHSLV